MEGSYPSKLRIWEGWTQPLFEEWTGSPGGPRLTGPEHPTDLAARLFAWEALNPQAVSPRTDEGAEPYTLQWFLNIEHQRHGREGRWLPRLLEFAKHRGETLLGLGRGLGTDWLQYARHGAAVTVCCPVASQLDLTRRNFELRGLSGRFLHAALDALPLETASIDVVCLNSLVDDSADSAHILEEVYRVLKPGGKVLAVVPAKYDVNYWAQLFLPWRGWCKRPGLRQDPPPGLSARRLRRLFHQFVECRIQKRQLRRRELPHLWRWLPRPVLERTMGRCLVLKGFKPLSAAVSVQLAA
jgi:SAM-dependent methyltransferase